MQVIHALGVIAMWVVMDSNAMTASDTRSVPEGRYEGTVHFENIGSIAAPMYYEHVGLQLNMLAANETELLETLLGLSRRFRQRNLTSECTAAWCEQALQDLQRTYEQDTRRWRDDLKTAHTSFIAALGVPVRSETKPKPRTIDAPWTGMADVVPRAVESVPRMVEAAPQVAEPDSRTVAPVPAGAKQSAPWGDPAALLNDQGQLSPWEAPAALLRDPPPQRVAIRAQPRPKRQAVALLSGILSGIGTIWSIGSSMYTDKRVQALEVKVQTEYNHQHRMDRMIEKLQRATKDAVVLQEKILFWVRTETILAQEIKKMENNIRDWTEGVYELRRQRLHPSLVPPHVIAMLKGQARAIAERANAHLVVDLEQDFHDLPFSWVFGEGVILIIFHVPLVADPQIMIRDLFKLDAAVLQGQRRLVRFLSEEPYISVDRRRETFAVYRESDLRKCKYLGEKYLCEGDGILKRRAGDCTSALFFSDQVLTKERCEVEVVEEGQAVVKLNEHEYYVQGDDRVTLSCPDRPVQHLYPGTQGVAVNVSGGCSLSGSTYDVYSAPDLGPLHTVKLNITIGQLTTLAPTAAHWARALVSDIQSMENILTREEKPDTSDEKKNGPGTSPYLWPGVVGTVALLIGLVIGGTTACWLGRGRGRNGRTENTPVTEPFSCRAQFVQDRESGHPAEAPEKALERAPRPARRQHQPAPATAPAPMEQRALASPAEQRALASLTEQRALASLSDIAQAEHHHRMRAAAERPLP